ncbi:MAG TPA: aminotransferase class I/II-fold pyridoxal phosphate-dependent enzyme [Streptosporangiaceae bacterium]
MEHPLAMDPEAMRRAGYATVDALVARLAEPEADPVLRRGQATDLRARLSGPPPEQPADYAGVLGRVLSDVLPYAARTDHPGYLAFVPSFTTWPAALAELTAAAANLYCGAWLESAGPAQVELEVIDWFRGWLGLPAGTAGVLVTGGSAANLTALLVAREAAGGPSSASVVYVSDQAHSSVARTARAMGLRPDQVRVLPTDDRWRLGPDTVVAAIRADRAAGHVPFALCASAGSTNTGAVDPLDGLADVCAAEGLWLHVDAAYGGFAALTAQGRRELSGIDRADSVTLDPHKWLYQPMECGCVLIRDGARLENTFAIHPDYLDGDATSEAGEVNFADRGLQLSRSFRALKVWMSVQTFGLAAFRACIERNLELARYAESLVRQRSGLTLTAPATLGIICFRREWPGCDEAEIERRGIALAAELERTGAALVSTTRLAGRHAVRLCILNPTTSDEHVRAVIEHFAAAPAPPGHADADMVPPDGISLLAGVTAATRRAIWDRGVVLDVAAGDDVTRRWDSDRFFYLILTGRYDVFIDSRLIRSLGPGDHFGELAARDWGGGYGYARLATVRCAEPGRLIRLTSEDLEWLTSTEPAVKARLAATLADRLQNR